MNMLKKIKYTKNLHKKFFSNKTKFDYEDPLNLKSLLSQEEVMV